jgi:putative MATE family efflux protein
VTTSTSSSTEGRAHVADIQDGRSLVRVLARMAVPTVLSGLLRSSFALVDTLTAGRLSTDAQAGLTTAVFFAWMFHSLSSMVSIGALSHVARATGAGDPDLAGRIGLRALAIAARFGALFSAAFFVTAPIAVTSSGLGEGALFASAYLRMLAVFGVFFWIQDTLEQTLRGAGFARVPVQVLLVTASLNALLNPFFAETLGMGLRGLALATGLSWGLGALALAVFARRRGLLRRSDGPVPRIRDFLRIGLPVAWSGVAFDLVWVALAPIAALTGPVTLAAIGIGHRLESIGYLTAAGLGHATAALVGQSLGASRAALARRITWAALSVGLSLNALWAIVLIVFDRSLYALFSVDEAVHVAGVDYIALCAVPMVFQSVETVLLGAFEGMGKTIAPFAVSLGSYLLRIPLAYGLVSLGAAGIFATTGITSMIAGVLVGLLFLIKGPRAGDERSR